MREAAEHEPYPLQFGHVEGGAYEFASDELGPGRVERAGSWGQQRKLRGFRIVSMFYLFHGPRPQTSIPPPPTQMCTPVEEQYEEEQAIAASPPKMLPPPFPMDPTSMPLKNNPPEAGNEQAGQAAQAAQEQQPAVGKAAPVVPEGQGTVVSE